MKRKRKEKPVLQVLLIAALALNTTLSFVVLANRNRMAQPTEKKEPVPAPAIITLEGATVEGNPQTAVNPASRPNAGVNSKRAHALHSQRRGRLLLQKSRKRRGQKTRLSFSPRPFSTGSRGIRFSSPEGMARGFLSQKGHWSVWQASPRTIRPWWSPKGETRTV